MFSFEKLLLGINHAAGTMLPALLLVVAERCVWESIFVPGGLARTVTSIEQRILAEMRASGPHSPQQPEPKVSGLDCGKCGAQYRLPESAIHRRCGLNDCDGRLHSSGR